MNRYIIFGTELPYYAALKISLVTVLLASLGSCTPHHGTPFRAYKDDLYSKMKLLQIFTGTSPIYRLEEFKNFAHTFSSNSFLVEPKTLEEIQQVILAARSLPDKCRIRMTGARHSWSPLFSDDETITLSTLGVTGPDGKRFWVNYEKDTGEPVSVTVLGGVTVSDMVQYLVQNKLEMSAGGFPWFRNPTVAGTVSTSSQGSSWTGSGISGLVIAMSIVDGTGKLRRFNAEEHPEEMRALRCCMGMCGVIYDVTFRAYPQRVYNVVTYLPTLRRLSEDTSLHQLLKSAVHPQIWGFTMNSMKDNDTHSWDLYNDIINARLVEKVLPLGTPAVPLDATTSAFCPFPALQGEEAYDGTVNLFRNSSEGQMYLPLAVTPIVVISESDLGGKNQAFYFPITDDFQRLGEVLQIYREEHMAAIQTGTIAGSTIIGIRLMRKPDCYLCQQAGAEHTLVFDVYANYPTTDYMFQRFMNRLTQRFEPFGVRFHWGKLQMFQNDVEHREHLQKVYGSNWKAFIQTRSKAGFDPDNLFLNDYFVKLFGDSL